ncbi:MAG: WG repeat-containing protein, partial [Deltaproteobacteria bacterium]|nr:WG repeat-containing protein [Deltaproteobacteria bacterium]
MRGLLRTLLIILGLIGVAIASYPAFASFELVPQEPDVAGPGKAGLKGGEDYHFYKFGSKYGYVDKLGKMVIVPSFDNAKNFDSFGLAKV